MAMLQKIGQKRFGRACGFAPAGDLDTDGVIFEDAKGRCACGVRIFLGGLGDHRKFLPAVVLLLV